MKHLAVFLVFCVVLAFGFEDDKRLVYGNDDRTEPYAITDSDLRNLIQADVAIFFTLQLSQNNDNSWSIDYYDSFTTGDCTGHPDTLCSNERFYGQTTGAFCSGFLVGEKTIVTAGHCVDGNDPTDMMVVFDWYQQSSGTGPEMNSIPEDNVYAVASYDHVLDNYEDWGVITLDRAVVGRTPLKYRKSGTPSVGDSLILVGHPWGLPMKVAPNAEVKDYPSNSNYFSANTDSYQGNSGSMVVNANTWMVEGILVTGNVDFAWDSANSCCRSNVCSDTTGCPDFEGITKITVAKINSSAVLKPALLLIALVALVLL